MTTDAFAKWIGDRRDRAEDMTFVIGGAFGLDSSVRDQASLVISLSPWTLPHEMARLLLAEQLYRRQAARSSAVNPITERREQR